MMMILYYFALLVSSAVAACVAAHDDHHQKAREVELPLCWIRSSSCDVCTEVKGCGWDQTLQKCLRGNAFGAHSGIPSRHRHRVRSWLWAPEDCSRRTQTHGLKVELDLSFRPCSRFPSCQSCLEHKRQTQDSSGCQFDADIQKCVSTSLATLGQGGRKKTSVFQKKTIQPQDCSALVPEHSSCQQYSTCSKCTASRRGSFTSRTTDKEEGENSSARFSSSLPSSCGWDAIKQHCAEGTPFGHLKTSVFSDKPEEGWIWEEERCAPLSSSGELSSSSLTSHLDNDHNSLRRAQQIQGKLSSHRSSSPTVAASSYAPCTSFTTCVDCTSIGSNYCGWTGSSCIPGSESGPQLGSNDAFNYWVFHPKVCAATNDGRDACPVTNCSQILDCTQCTARAAYAKSLQQTCYWNIRSGTCVSSTDLPFDVIPPSRTYYEAPVGSSSGSWLGDYVGNSLSCVSAQVSLSEFINSEENCYGRGSCEACLEYAPISPGSDGDDSDDGGIGVPGCGWDLQTMQCRAGDAQGPFGGYVSKVWISNTTFCPTSSITSCSLALTEKQCTDSFPPNGGNCVWTYTDYLGYFCSSADTYGAEPECSDYSSCTDCTTSTGCGWNHNKQLCMKGTWTGPNLNAYSDTLTEERYRPQQWDFTSDQCGMVQCGGTCPYRSGSASGSEEFYGVCSACLSQSVNCVYVSGETSGDMAYVTGCTLGTRDGPVQERYKDFGYTYDANSCDDWTEVTTPCSSFDNCVECVNHKVGGAYRLCGWDSNSSKCVGGNSIGAAAPGGVIAGPQWTFGGQEKCPMTWNFIWFNVKSRSFWIAAAAITFLITVCCFGCVRCCFRDLKQSRQVQAAAANNNTTTATTTGGGGANAPLMGGVGTAVNIPGGAGGGGTFNTTSNQQQQGVGAGVGDGDSLQGGGTGNSSHHMMPEMEAFED